MQAIVALCIVVRPLLNHCAVYYLVQDLAKRKKIKTLGVSMGQGQEIIARKYMATATAEGQWVLLQNTHLGLAYLTEVCTYAYYCAHRVLVCIGMLVVPA